jgi:hypothetical protein
MGGKILLYTLSKFKTLTKYTKDWEDSGSELDEKTNATAPNKKSTNLLTSAFCSLCQSSKLWQSS